MGNCLFLQKRVVQVMRTNGEILEYRSPIKVYQILSEFVNYAIVDKISVHNHLSPDDELLEGHLYYLLPIAPCPKTDTKSIKQPNPIAEAGQAAGVVRIKLMISKKELQAMLREGLTVKDIVSQEIQNVSDELQNRRSSKKLHNTGGVAVSCQGWAPILESIPEVN